MNFEVKDLTGLGAPITKLIEVVSNGIGVMYKPRAIRKEAEAQAYSVKLLGNAEASTEAVKLQAIGMAQAANKIALAEAENEILDRAKVRIVYRELQRQLNIEAISEAAINELPDKVSAEPVDEDWRTRFFNIAENVSNTDMQALWGKVLAGEVALPGRFSLRTLDVLKNLSQHEAVMFQKIRSLVFVNEFIFTINAKVDFEKYGITYKELLELRAAGILQEGDSFNATLSVDPADNQLLIPNNGLRILITSPTVPKVNFAVLKLTSAGKELASLIDDKPNMQYLNDLALSLRPKGFRFRYAPESEQELENYSNFIELGIDEVVSK